jgi:hypothetical protein
MVYALFLCVAASHGCSRSAGVPTEPTAAICAQYATALNGLNGYHLLGRKFYICEAVHG